VIRFPIAPLPKKAVRPYQPDFSKLVYDLFIIITIIPQEPHLHPNTSRPVRNVGDDISVAEV
jgi:hypothetical protein